MGSARNWRGGGRTSKDSSGALAVTEGLFCGTWKWGKRSRWEN